MDYHLKILILKNLMNDKMFTRTLCQDFEANDIKCARKHKRTKAMAVCPP